MRLVFAGTPDFAVPALAAIAGAGHRIAAVLTRPDRPAGRGLAAAGSPVKRAAADLGVPVLQPSTLEAADVQAGLRALAPDALVVAAYGLILPQAVLDIPRLGAINIHASLLPILPDDTAGTLHDRLAALGARLVVAALDRLARGALEATPQPAAGATYAAKLGKEEARIDWSRRAVELERMVRAFDPFPGAATRLHGSDLKLWRARVVAGEDEPGTVIASGPPGIVVACGDHALRVEVLQRAGGKRLAAAEFLRGYPVAPGDRFA